jgi:hypothetical protein
MTYQVGDMVQVVSRDAAVKAAEANILASAMRDSLLTTLQGYFDKWYRVGEVVIGHEGQKYYQLYCGAAYLWPQWLLKEPWGKRNIKEVL